MQLTYRGSSYETDGSSIEMIEGSTIGKYRGAALKEKFYASTPPRAAAGLKYRGCSYLSSIR
jgi:hypothetical protein